MSKNRLRKEKNLPANFSDLFRRKKTDIGEPEMEQEEKFVFAD